MRTAKSAIHAKAGEGPCGLENAKMALSQIEGVFDVEANHVLDLIKVEYDQDRVTLAQIRRIVKKACTEQRIGAKNLWGLSGIMIGLKDEATVRVSARRSQTCPAEWWLSAGYKA